MPESKRRIVKPYEPPEPVETTVELTGVKAEMFACPICGRSSQDRALIETDIASHPKPGGDA